MPSELYIIKEGKTEKYNNDRAVGTMIMAGVDKSIAIETVTTARALFEELKVSYVEVDEWVKLSEEIRRGNIATAVTIIKNLPNEGSPTSETQSHENYILNLSEDAIIDITKEVLARPDRSDAYGYIQANEDFYVSTIALSDPLLGYVTARYNELVEYSILNAGNAVASKVFTAFANVISELNLDVSNEAFSRFKKRYYKMTSTISESEFHNKKKQLKSLINEAANSGKLKKGAMENALNKTSLRMSNNTISSPPPIESLDPLSDYRLSDEDEKTTRTRPVVNPPTSDVEGLPSRPRQSDDGDDPRDTPPPNISGEVLDNLHYVRWTTTEWPPFIKPDRHSLYCWKPIREDDGDRTKLVELRDGLSLTKADPKAKQLQFIEKNWVERIEEYWQPAPKIANLIPEGEATWVDTFIIDTSDTDEQDELWKDIEDLIREELDKESTEEKIEEEIEDAIDDILGDVNVYGVPVGSAASGVAKMTASMLIEFISWLLDEIFSYESFQQVVVTHKTVGTKNFISGDEVKSWLTWGKSGRDSGTAEKINPRIDDGSSGGLETVLLDQWKGLQQQWYNQDKAFNMPGIFWRGECDVPNRLPSEINKIFLLGNSFHGEIYWPPDTNWGGHIFIPIHAQESDSVYCLAIRTEVRTVWLQTW